MKFIGFIKEQDEYSFGKSLKKDYLYSQKETEHRNEILDYLKRGKLCLALMGLAEDDDEKRMGTISVYTDGEWFWPDYLNGYLKNFKNFKIDEDFTKHVLKNKEKEVELTEEELLKLEKEFSRIAGFK
jgi:hypothetical protein